MLENTYRYKGRIYSALKEYNEEKVPLEVQAKEFQKTLFSKKKTDLPTGLARDNKGRIRKVKDIINQAPTKKEKALLKQRITLTEISTKVTKKVKGKTRHKFVKTYEYRNDKGEKVTKREFDFYLKRLQKENLPADERTVYNQSIITQAVQFLAEGKKVVLKIGGKKVTLDKNNLEKFIKDTKKMLSEFYKNQNAQGEKKPYKYIVFTAALFGDNYAEIDLNDITEENTEGTEDEDEDEDENFNFKSFYK